MSFFLFSFLEHMVLVIIQCCHELTFLCSPRFRPRTIPQVFPCFSHCFSETDDDVCSQSFQMIIWISDSPTCFKNTFVLQFKIQILLGLSPPLPLPPPIKLSFTSWNVTFGQTLCAFSSAVTTDLLSMTSLYVLIYSCGLVQMVISAFMNI